jgi:long-subunit acyl-CoA synthetase (AMP-forming)
MRQAADILASPAAMQIRQLEACMWFICPVMCLDFSHFPNKVQHMAKSGQSKVIFVPMHLQSDVVKQLNNAGGGGGGSTAVDNGEGSSSL